MAKHAQPRELAELKGATTKNPQRYRNVVPKSELPIGDAPDHMSDDARNCWHEISFKAIPGALTYADTLLLEVAANLLVEYRSDPVAFQVGKYTHLVGILARFGMSPSDRTKLGVDESKDQDEWDAV